MTHWRKFVDPEHMGSYDLPNDKDTILTIKSVVKKEVSSPEGKKSSKPVIYWHEQGQKPMIVNSTNARTIAKIYASNEVEDWHDKKVQLFVTQVKAFGEMQDVIRIRPMAPVIAKPKLADTAKAKAAIAAGQITIEAIKARYDITAEQVKELTNA